MTNQVFTHVNPERLRSHPLNQKVFGDKPDDEFIESVRERGVISPCIVTSKHLIISGHRRRQAAIIVGLKEVPVIIREDLDDGDAADMAWFESNRQREMTSEQKARWFKVRKDIEASKAKGRQGTRTDIPQNSSECSGADARDVAATEVGWSHDTATKAAQVVDAIDEAEQAGDTETATELREALNNGSVHAASQKIKGDVKAEGNGQKTDKHDVDVPEHLADQFAAAGLIRGLVKNLGTMRTGILKHKGQPGFEWVHWQEFERAMKQAANELTFSAMETRCPECDGDENCKTCGGYGFLNKSAFRQLSDIQRNKLGIA